MNGIEKKVFLTGASSGIGLEIARLLVTNGFHVWGTSREIKRLPTLPNYHAVEMDLSDIGSIRRGFSAALKKAGHFDVLVNNAGAGWFGPVEMQSDEIVRGQFQLMVHGPLELIRLALPKMREHDRGHIVNVTSLAARFPIPYLGPYSATKAALSALSENLRYELAHTQIRITDVQPGDIDTGFHASTRRLDQSMAGNPQAAIDAPRIAEAWRTIDHNMAVAPHPQIVARAILRVVQSANPPPVVTVGGFFQARLAPFLVRFAPRRLTEWFSRRYYGI